VLDLGVVGHRTGQRQRSALVQPRDGEVEGPLGDAGVDVRETQQAPGEHSELEQAGTGEARGADQADPLVGDDGAVQDRVVALGRAHAEHVPGRLDAVPMSVSGQEAVDDPRVVRVAGVHAVHAEVGPHRRQAAEHLVAGEHPAAVDPLGAGVGQEQRGVVAGLAVAGGEDVARPGLLEDPGAAAIAGTQQVRGHAGPVQVHVHGDGGRGRVVGEPALQLPGLGQRQAGPAVLGGQGDVQVPQARSSSKSSWKKRLSRSYSGARSSKRASIRSVSTVPALDVVAVIGGAPSSFG
jgi:hypothetical protein